MVAENNYWGTADGSIIAASITGTVDCDPFETESVVCVPTPEGTPAFTTTDAAIALQIAVGNREYGSRWDVNSDEQVASLDALMRLNVTAKGREQESNQR